MHLGIDLGTSNSAIVGSEDGRLRLFKTAEGMDVMPSALMLDPRGGLFVGRRAYDQAAFSPQQVQQKFKRLMGTGSTIEFPGTQRTMSPEEASAEVIKALISQVKRDIPDLSIDGTVITIPAAFNQMQSEATMRSAQIAGLEKVALLQEPIAAAMAAISGGEQQSGLFLIYDLGGGTFDAAIVQSVAGNITVVAHAGVNMLGGTDFDLAIVNSVVRPWLLEHFKLPHDFQTQPEFDRLIRIARYRAELSKIALSGQGTDQIFADENQIRTKDTSGEDIFIDISISRSDLELLVAEKVERSIAECRNLLSSNGYSPSDMDSIILIGGPSRMPYVRERIGFELGIEIDTKVDPMTAVSTGAAIYAASRDWASQTVAGPLTSRKTKNSTSALNLSFEYIDHTASSEIRIRIRTPLATIPTGTTIQIEAENGWTTGKLPLQDGLDVKGVPLPKVGKNQVKVIVSDADGTLIDDASTTLQIERLIATADGMPLMHNLAIKVVTGGRGTERNALKAIAKKGSPTPAMGMEALRAARDLRAGEKASLIFELFEQADDVDDPALNLAIGSFELTGDSLMPGQMVRKGDTVNVHWSIDANSLLHCHFELSDAKLEYNLTNMYVPTTTAKYDGEDGSRLAKSSVADAQRDLEHLEEALGAKLAGKSDAIRSKIDANARSLQLSDDPDTKRMVSEEARFIRQEIHRIRNSPENIVAVQQSELDDFSNSYAQYFAREIDSDTNSKIARQVDFARDAIRRGDANETKQALDEARALLNAFMMEQPDFWIIQFERFTEERFNAVDKATHDELAQRGQSAISANDISDLRTVVIEMSKNMVLRDQGSNVTMLAGLMV